MKLKFHPFATHHYVHRGALTFSDPHFLSAASQMKRIPPIANTMEAHDGQILKHKPEVCHHHSGE